MAATRRPCKKCNEMQPFPRFSQSTTRPQPTEDKIFMLVIGLQLLKRRYTRSALHFGEASERSDEIFAHSVKRVSLPPASLRPLEMEARRRRQRRPDKAIVIKCNARGRPLCRLRYARPATARQARYRCPHSRGESVDLPQRPHDSAVDQRHRFLNPAHGIVQHEFRSIHLSPGTADGRAG
jgi:hypothetical protein